MSLEKQLVDLVKQIHNEKRLGDKRAEQFYDAIVANGDLLAAHASRHELGGADQVDHDNLLNFVANKHIDWTNAAVPFLTTSTLRCSTITFDGAAIRALQHNADNQGAHLCGGSTYTHGASIQFFGEDHAILPGHAYIVSGSHDASPASIIEFAYRDAGVYKKILTLDNLLNATFGNLVGIGGAIEAGIALKIHGQTLKIYNSAVNGTAEIQLENDARKYSFGVSGALSDNFLIYDNTAPGTRVAIDSSGYMYLYNIRSGATQAAAGAAANELWKTNGHATLPNNVVMIGV